MLVTVPMIPVDITVAAFAHQ